MPGVDARHSLSLWDGVDLSRFIVCESLHTVDRDQNYV